MLRSEARAYDAIGDNKEIRKLLERMFSPRLSSSERTRRALGIAILSSERTNNEEGGSFMSKKKMKDFGTVEDWMENRYRYVVRVDPVDTPRDKMDFLKFSSPCKKVEAFKRPLQSYRNRLHLYAMH